MKDRTTPKKQTLKDILKGRVDANQATALLSGDGWFWDFQSLSPAETEASAPLLIALAMSMTDEQLATARLTEKEIMLMRLYQAKCYTVHPNRPELLRLDISTFTDSQITGTYDRIKGFPAPFQKPGT